MKYQYQSLECNCATSVSALNFFRYGIRVVRIPQINREKKMNKLKLASLLCLAIFLSLSQANAQSALGVAPKVKAILNDKDNIKYEFRLLYNIRHGVVDMVYDFGANNKFKILFKGRSFGDSENCPPAEIKNIKLDNAVIRHSFKKADFNGDGISDLNLSIAERNCKTGAITFIEKLLLSSSTGFELKELQQGLK
jgi:hypothetical protein